MKKLLLLTAAVILLASQAIGAPLNGKTAKKMLFSPKGSEFRIVAQDTMGKTDLATLKALLGMKEIKAILYYGAIAMSPKQGLAHESTAASANHHSLAAASAQALKQCNILRGGGPKCVVVVNIIPKKYVERPLTLSVSATTAFRRTYLKGRGGKAMAISPATGEYAVAKGSGAAKIALKVCAKAARAKYANDCQIVIEDQ